MLLDSNRSTKRVDFLDNTRYFTVFVIYKHVPILYLLPYFIFEENCLNVIKQHSNIPTT